MPVTVSVLSPPLADDDAQLVADRHAEVARQLGADQDVGARSRRGAAAHDLVGQRHDAEVELGIDADHRDRAARVAAHGERRAGRPSGDTTITSGIARICGDDRLPLVDRLQALQRRLDDRVLDAPAARVGRGRARAPPPSAAAAGCAAAPSARGG